METWRMEYERLNVGIWELGGRDMRGWRIGYESLEDGLIRNWSGKNYRSKGWRMGYGSLEDGI